MASTMRRRVSRGFTLLEVLLATAIMAVGTTSVLVVIATAVIFIVVVAGTPTSETVTNGQIALLGIGTTLGIATLRCGETLEPHRHSEPETYYTLSGRGIVTIDGVPHPVTPGTAIYIPGDAEHGIRNDYDEDLQILYVFAVSDFNQVVYRF